MRQEFVTKGFEKTEAMEQFLQEATSDLIETFLKHEKDIHIRVAIDEDSHRNQGRKPHFLCEVQLKTAGSKKLFKTHKTSNEFHAAVHDALKAMKTMLQKRSERRHTRKITSGDPGHFAA